MNNAPAKYVVISDFVRSRFESEVLSYIALGWRLVGGVAVLLDEAPDADGKLHRYMYFQAVTKNIAEDERVEKP